MRRLLLTALLAVTCVASACSGGGSDESSGDPSSPTSSSASSPSAPAAPECEALLSQDDAETAFGDSLGEPKVADLAGLPACQWSGGAGGVQVVDVAAEEWAQQLPALIKQYEASGVPISPSAQRKLDRGVALVQSAGGVDGDQACTLFSTLVTRLQGQKAGATTITTVLPSAASPQAVSAQRCEDGTYASVLVASTQLSPSQARQVASRAEAALASLGGA